MKDSNVRVGSGRAAPAKPVRRSAERDRRGAPLSAARRMVSSGAGTRPSASTYLLWTDHSRLGILAGIASLRGAGLVADLIERPSICSLRGPDELCAGGDVGAGAVAVEEGSGWGEGGRGKHSPVDDACGRVCRECLVYEVPAESGGPSDADERGPWRTRPRLGSDLLRNAGRNPPAASRTSAGPGLPRPTAAAAKVYDLAARAPR